MKPSELRIGNWVQRPENLRIPMLDGDTIYFRVNSLMIMDCERIGEHWAFEPIPLDAEWLERFGFKQVKLDRKPFYELAIENIKFIYYAGNLEFGVIGVSQYEFVKMPKTEYVHQLQNLYYCLTHTELTKKEI